jgi:hypothetical protein
MGRFLKGCRLAVSSWIKAPGESRALSRAAAGVESVEIDEMPGSGLKKPGRTVDCPGKRFLDGGVGCRAAESGRKPGHALKSNDLKKVLTVREPV